MNDDLQEKRMAGDYEIIQGLHIGDREIVLGENPRDETGMKYMCAFCRQNALFAEYSEVMASDDFPEIAELFGRRVAEQAQKTRIELNKPRIQGINDRLITAESCTPLSGEDDLHGKIVVVKPDVLRREYRRATHQLKLCTGGFGASPHSRGTACFCIDLYTGKESRTLGKTGITVNKNGFGALPIQRISDEEAVLLLRKACDNGITFFDTALCWASRV